MTYPGAGRYTTYIPTQANGSLERYKSNYNLFNKNSSKGDFFGTKAEDALKLIIARATAKVNEGVGGLLPSEGFQKGDANMFPEDVDLKYGKAPNTKDTGTDKAVTITISSSPPLAIDLPWTPYVPNISSPGVENGVSSVGKPFPTSEQKNSFKSNNPDSDQNVASPSETSKTITTFSTLGQALKLGSSKKS